MSLADFPNVVRLSGDIDLHVAPETAALLQRVIATRPSRFVIDLSAVSYLDSSGLSVLITAVNDVEEYGGRLMLTGLQEGVKVIIESGGLSQFFLTFPHVDAALAAI
jgi:anti-anti-sigma factor